MQTEKIQESRKPEGGSVHAPVKVKCPELDVAVKISHGMGIIRQKIIPICFYTLLKFVRMIFPEYNHQ